MSEQQRKALAIETRPGGSCRSHWLLLHHLGRCDLSNAHFAASYECGTPALHLCFTLWIKQSLSFSPRNFVASLPVCPAPSIFVSLPLCTSQSFSIRAWPPGPEAEGQERSTRCVLKHLAPPGALGSALDGKEPPFLVLPTADTRPHTLACACSLAHSLRGGAGAWGSGKVLSP